MTRTVQLSRAPNGDCAHITIGPCVPPLTDGDPRAFAVYQDEAERLLCVLADSLPEGTLDALAVALLDCYRSALAQKAMGAVDYVQLLREHGRRARRVR